MEKKIAVVMGGPGLLHNASLRSGQSVFKTLRAGNYNAVPVTIDARGYWLIGEKDMGPFSEPEAILALERAGVGLVFNALHSDGALQHLLANAGIPFTGSEALSVALASNRSLTYRSLVEHGFVVPTFEVVQKYEWARRSTEAVRAALAKVGVPLLVKSSRRASEPGVRIMSVSDANYTPLHQALDHVFRFDREAILQHFVSGRAISVSVLERYGRAAALDPVPYDPTLHISGVAAQLKLPEPVAKLAQDTALRTHVLFRSSGYSRSDMIWGHDSKLYVTNVDTEPELTEESLLPRAAFAAGIRYPKLLDMIVESALV